MSKFNVFGYKFVKKTIIHIPMRFSKLNIFIFCLILFATTFTKAQTPKDQGQSGKVPGAPETPQLRAIEINPDDQKFNDSLLNAKKGPNTKLPAQGQGGIITAADAAKQALRDKIFGSNIFNNKNLKFEPNLNIATPVDYRLGPGDKLIVDLYGFSQKNFNLIVQPDGFINVDKFGLIAVNGLTVEEAKERIKNKLSKIYVGLSSSNGYSTNTYLNVSLGDLRTIRVYVIGDAMLPGTYSIPAISSIMTPLHLAGGPSEIGSFRNIQLIRKDKVVAKIDLYDFITTGIKGNDLRLQDEDRIQISSYQTRIELIGNIKKPGLFELLPNESLEKAIEYSGGFTEDAYTNKLRVMRNTDRGHIIIDVPGNEIKSFKLQNGDKITIDKILERIENQVIINGAIFRPGPYSLTENPTLLALLKSAEGPKEDAYLQKVRIIRLKPDLTTSVFSVNLAKLLNGEISDIPLLREDRIEVSSNFDLKEIYTVGIRGEINKIDDLPIEDPTKINAPKKELIMEKAPYYNDMTLMDIIMYANGLKESAAGGSIDVIRRKRKSGALDDLTITSDLGKTYSFNIKSNLQLEEKDALFLLEPFDEVFVRASPNYETQQFITVTGQVIKQGPYGLERKDERLSDIIKRTGGLSDFAFVEGATLVRQNVLTDLEIENKKQQLDALKPTKNGTLELDQVATITKERIGIDLDKAIKNPGSNYDIILQDGDILTIPKKPQTVKLSGEVLYPNTTQFDENFSFKDYISRAGGYTGQSLKGSSYILYANGSVDRTKKIFLFKIYPKVRPGSEIVVPLKNKRTTFGEVVGTLAGVSTAMTTIIGILTLLKLK
jgi:protein involved in polysaccharide export with SLBB domain